MLSKCCVEKDLNFTRQEQILIYTQRSVGCCSSALLTCAWAATETWFPDYTPTI